MHTGTGVALLAIIKPGMIDVNRKPTINTVARRTVCRVMSGWPVGVAALTFIGRRVIKVDVVPVIGIMTIRALAVIVI